MPDILTDARIRSEKPSEKRREVPDGKIGGLYLVVQPSGARSWAVRYRVDGTPKKLTIGPYPGIDLATARKRAQEAIGEIARGSDPAADKKAKREAARKAQKVTVDRVDKVVTSFIDRYARPKTRDWKETQRLLEKDIVGAWGSKRLSDIGRADVHELLDSIIDRGAPVGANRTFAQLRKMCRWAVERGIIASNPCDGIRAPSTETSRDRVLEDAELRLVWNAAGTLGYPFAPIIRLLILTGQRRDEVAHAVWSEFDLEKKIWTIPAERSKNRRSHSVPLSDSALDILKTLPKFEREIDSSTGAKKPDFLFSGGATPPSGFSKVKARLEGRISTTADEAEPMAPFVLHDLRRSVASGMARIGVDLHVIERCLNHVSGSFGGIVGVYQRHSYADEMRKALDAWARHIETIICCSAISNVVELASARG